MATYMEDIHAHQIGRRQAAIRKHPVAGIICPLGCQCFFNKARSIPYIKQLKIVVKHGQGKLFPAARGNWPYEAHMLVFELYAALHLKKGLPCVLACEEHTDSQLSKEVIHMPLDPVSSSTE